MYKKLPDAWLDLTVLEAEEWDRALKNRIFGDAELYKELLNNELVKVADGVKYFRNTLRTHFVHESSACVPVEILSK